MKSEKKESQSASRGRPTKKTPELIDSILTKVTEGKGLKEIAKLESLDHTTILKWLIEDEDFSTRYARAKAVLMDLMAEEIIQISDHSEDDREAFVGINHIHRDKLKVDTRKWLMSKLAAKKYGDKLDVTSGGEKVEGVKVEIVRRQEDSSINPETN